LAARVAQGRRGVDSVAQGVAPSPQLRKWFGHDPACGTESARRYRAELTHNDEAVGRLAELSRRGPLTLLYAAHDTAHNHAVVLAAYWRCARQRRAPTSRRLHACIRSNTTRWGNLLHLEGGQNRHWKFAAPP